MVLRLAVVEAAAAVAIAYLIGSIDFGAILPRLAGVDIYAVGSGNPGASNVMRTMGRKWAVAVLVGDIAKGFVAAMIGDLWVSEPVGFACLFGVVVGHCYPLWHRFKGGKGVAAAGGALLWLEPLLGLVATASWGLVLALTKVASIASLAAVGSMPFAGLAFDNTGWSFGWALATAALIYYRHRGNLARLVRGEERTVTSA